MAELQYSVYVAPSKLAVSDDLPPGEDRRMGSPRLGAGPGPRLAHITLLARAVN